MQAADLLSKRAELTPKREALLDLYTATRYSYKQLNDRASRVANLLRDSFGVRKGDRVSILAHNTVAYVDLFYGVAKIGAVLAPLNWRLVARELVYIANDCQPRVLFVGPEFVEVAGVLQRESAIEHYIALEGASVDHGVRYEEALAHASVEEPERPSLGGEDPYCLLYTSGTTGPPKGAVLPHRQILWNCINTVASWGLHEDDVSPIFVPLFHAGGLFAFMTPLLYLGGRLVLARSLEVEDSLRVIERERCTVILGVPTIYQMWLNADAFADVDLRHVRFFISGGAPCPESIMSVWRESKGVVFRQGYGLTEVGPNCFSMTDEESVAKSGSVGKPIFHSEMRIVDDAGGDLPPEQVGELLIRGPHICSGYWGNPQATATAIRDGWFHTGDMARRDSDGFFYVVGRFKDMIISGGENIYAAEVEAVILEHPDVVEAALIGAPDEKFGEIGVIVVVPRAGVSPSAQDVLRVCEGRLASYKVPKRVQFTDALPYSPYGKVQKAELKKRFVD